MALLNKIKEVIRLFPSYLVDNIKLRARNRKSSNIKTYIYLETKDIYYEDMGRYLYLLLRFFTFAEGKVALVKKIGFADYYRLGIYGRKIYELDNIVFTKEIPKKADNKILIYDRNLPKWTSKTWEQLIKIEFDISLPIPQHSSWAFMPYPMHPCNYSKEQYSNIKCLQSSSRKIRVFFAGNVDPRVYSNTEPQSILGKFKVIPRATVIETVTSQLDNEILPVENWQHMQLLLNSDYIKKCIILHKSNFKIPAEKWLDVIAKSDFFLCAPGVRIPLCHNAIESMAVGTIPITNYPDWFFPSLEHLKNCIKFNTKEDLVEAIKLVLSMEQSQIKQLHKNVIEYYEKYLSCDSFLTNTVYSNKPEITVFVNAHTNKYLHKITKDSIIMS